ALMFDFRCVGDSGCPASGNRDPVADTAGAMAALRAHGAKSVAIVGASLGGVVSVMAGAALHPNAVVDLSGEKTLGDLLPGVTLNAYAAAPRLKAPALFVVAHGDPGVSIADTRAVYRQASSRTKRLIVLPVVAGHGWDMVSLGLGWTPLAREIVRFV